MTRQNGLDYTIFDILCFICMKILRMFLMFSLNVEINRQSRFIESIKLSREILNDDIRYIDNRLINKYGDIDPGVLLYLMDRRSMDARGSGATVLPSIGSAGCFRYFRRHAYVACQRRPTRIAGDRNCVL